MTVRQLRVVAGRDLAANTEKLALEEVIAEWLRRIELAVMGGELRRVDYMLAKS